MPKAAVATTWSIKELRGPTGEANAVVSRLTHTEELLCDTDNWKGQTDLHRQELEASREEAMTTLKKKTAHLIGRKVCFIGPHAVRSAITEGNDHFEVRKTPDNGYGYGFLDDLSVRKIDTIGEREFRRGLVFSLGSVTFVGGNGAGASSPDCLLPCSQTLTGLVVSECEEFIIKVSADSISGQAGLPKQ